MATAYAAAKRDQAEPYVSNDISPERERLVCQRFEEWAMSQPTIIGTAFWSPSGWMFRCYLVEERNGQSRTMNVNLEIEGEPSILYVELGGWRSGSQLVAENAVIDSAKLPWKRGGIDGGMPTTGVAATPQPAPSVDLSGIDLRPKALHELLAINEELAALLGSTETPSPQVFGRCFWEAWCPPQLKAKVEGHLVDVQAKYHNEARTRAMVKVFTMVGRYGRLYQPSCERDAKGWVVTNASTWLTNRVDPLEILLYMQMEESAYPPVSDPELTAQLYGLFRQLPSSRRDRIQPEPIKRATGETVRRGNYNAEGIRQLIEQIISGTTPFDDAMVKRTGPPQYIGATKLPGNYAALWLTSPVTAQRRGESSELSLWLFVNRGGQNVLIDYLVKVPLAADQVDERTLTGCRRAVARICTIPVSALGATPAGGAGQYFSLAEAGGMPLAQLLRRLKRMLELNNQAEVTGYLSAKLASPSLLPTAWQQLRLLATTEEESVMFLEDHQGNVTLTAGGLVLRARHTKSHLLVVTELSAP
ncbi:hypothetical protein HY374_03450 [Candidatus Berkelbacteria bacterium]|nr:hypothetical protein [Candidatus Berkelbacteria bacterium]